MSDWMKARSRSAWGDCATFSGILHVTHMTWRSITGSDTGLALALAAADPQRRLQSASALSVRAKQARRRFLAQARVRDRHEDRAMDCGAAGVGVAATELMCCPPGCSRDSGTPD